MSKSSTRAFKRLLWSLHFFFCGSGALLILQSTFFLKVKVSSFLRAERKVHRVGLVVPTSDWNPLCQPSTMLFDRGKLARTVSYWFQRNFSDWRPSTITYPSILKVITKRVHVTRAVSFKNIPKLNNRPGLNKRKSPNHLETLHPALLQWTYTSAQVVALLPPSQLFSWCTIKSFRHIVRYLHHLPAALYAWSSCFR